MPIFGCIIEDFTGVPDKGENADQCRHSHPVHRRQGKFYFKYCSTFDSMPKITSSR